MENKTSRKLGKRRILYLKKQKHMMEVIKARREAARNNPELQASEPTQCLSAGSKEYSSSTSFKAWVASVTNQPDIEVSTSGQVSNPAPAPPTSQATTSSFREWVAAQAASTSGNQSSSLYMTIEPLQATLPQVSSEPIVSTEPEYIALPEPEILDIIVKEECDKPSDTIVETDILASCSTSQLTNIELEPPTTAEIDTKVEELKVYLKPRIKTRTTKRNISQKTYVEKKPKNLNAQPKSNSTTKRGRPPGTKKPRPSQTLKLETENKRPRGRPPLMPPCRCRTKQCKDASTSTEDLIRVKEERNDSEELRLFFELCDKYLDEPTAEVVKLRASANVDSSWLIVTDS